MEYGEKEPAPEDQSLLAAIWHGVAHRQSLSDPRRLEVGLAPLAGAPFAEAWRVAGSVDTRFQDGIAIAEGGGFLFASLLADDGKGTDLADLSRDLYARILMTIRDRGYPHPLRFWNLLSDIHGQSGGLERYRAFCVGRDRAFRSAGIVPERFPAATAVGSRAHGLLIYLLAGRTPGQPVENPRQLSAYRYPPRYGPRPPSFARALRCSWPRGGLLLVSGTASVVGHRSLHPDDLSAQIRETLRNLDATIKRALAGPPLCVKVFLRDPTRLAETDELLRSWTPAGVPIRYLQADVCRQELQVEIEAVCEAGHLAATS